MVEGRRSLASLVVAAFYLFILGNTFAKQNYVIEATVLSPTGTNEQLDRAREAAGRGSPIMAMKFSDGIGVLTANKNPVSFLQLQGPQQVNRIDDRIILLATGLLSDAASVVDASKDICTSTAFLKTSAECTLCIGQRYIDDFAAPIPVELFCNKLSSSINEYSRRGKGRPLGVNLIVCGWDDITGFQTYSVDCEGGYCSWNEIALGQLSEQLLADTDASLTRIIGNIDNRAQLSLQDGLPVLIESARKRLAPFALRMFVSKDDPVSPPPSGEVAAEEDGWTPQILICRLENEKKVLWRRIKV
jgi:20S proteasome alpha/beta subunit